MAQAEVQRGIEHAARHVGNHADPQPPAQAGFDHRQLAPQRLRVGQRRARVGQHGHAGGRRLQALARAGEQRCQEDVLDLAQRLGHGRLGEIEFGGHARDGTLALERQQQRQMPQAQARNDVVEQLVGRNRHDGRRSDITKW
ncbi:hypothetical protein D3C86_1466790 [compost metagenome]